MGTVGKHVGYLRVVEPAPELADFLERFLRYWAAADAEQSLDAISRHEGVLMLGSAPEEWWDGADAISAIMKVTAQEYRAAGGFCFTSTAVSAWKEGSVGWAASKGTVQIGDRDPVPGTVTVVVHEDGPHWRIVQGHFAVDVANEDAIGMTMTTSVEDLLQLVQDESALAAGMAPDGSVTIMFTDIQDSTALMEAIGEARWLALLEWHDRQVTRQVAAYGGTVVKGQGDGFMLAFPASGSALACAVAIERALRSGWEGQQVAARIGIHMGNAKAEGGDFFGRSVVVAARIAGAATGGEILVSGAVRDGLSDTFSFIGPRVLSLKGLAGTHEVYALWWS